MMQRTDIQASGLYEGRVLQAAAQLAQVVLVIGQGANPVGRICSQVSFRGMELEQSKQLPEGIGPVVGHEERGTLLTAGDKLHERAAEGLGMSSS